MSSTRPPRFALEANPIRKKVPWLFGRGDLFPPHSPLMVYCKKPIYFITSLAKMCQSFYPESPRVHYCSLLDTYSYTTRPTTSAQKAGIPTNPLSPLLFILSSNRLCDKVLSEDAVSFKAPYFRAAVAPLFISYIPSSEKISLQSIQNEETVNLVNLAFYLLIED
jgi:hypothetical protein